MNARKFSVIASSEVRLFALNRKSCAAREGEVACLHRRLLQDHVRIGATYAKGRNAGDALVVAALPCSGGGLDAER
jgi:hypothetical protein